MAINFKFTTAVKQKTGRTILLFKIQFVKRQITAKISEGNQSA